MAQRRAIQLVPQDSAGSLNPRRRVGGALIRPLRLLHGLDRDAALAEAIRLLQLVELPAHLTSLYPGQLSGGQRQRVAIARALSARPEILVCDEMTSSLDVRVEAEVLDVVAGLRHRLGLGIILITHDLGVLARLADRVLVLRDGQLCEQGRTADVLSQPRHAWTRSVVAAATEVPFPPAALTASH